MDSLAKQLTKSLSNAQKQIEVLKSKFFLTDVCFEKAVDAMALAFAKGHHNPLVKFFSGLRNQVCTSFVAMSQMQSHVAEEIAALKELCQEKIRAKQQELDKAQNRVVEVSKQKERDLARLEAQISEMRTMVEELSGKLKESQVASIDYKKETEKQIEELQAENSKLTDLIVKHSIQIGGKAASGRSTTRVVEDKKQDPRMLMKYAVSSRVTAGKSQTRNHQQQQQNHSSF